MFLLIDLLKFLIRRESASQIKGGIVTPLSLQSSPLIRLPLSLKPHAIHVVVISIQMVRALSVGILMLTSVSQIPYFWIVPRAKLSIKLVG